MIKFQYATIFCFFVRYSVISQGVQDSLAMPVDSTAKVALRTFEGNLAEKYQGKEFNYNLKDGESKNLLSRLISWLLDVLNDVFGIDLPPGTIQVLEYIVYFALVLVAVYLLVKFFTGENASAIFRKKATSSMDINLEEEHIANLDLDSLISDALTQGNYRLAIRYQYLKVLKTLAQQQLIVWDYEKTNLDYQKEIDTPNVKVLFRDVSYVYDHIWYGEKEIDEERYKAVQHSFTSLYNITANG